MMCEKCWGDAYLRMLTNGRPQADNYREQDKPCSEAEQRGGDD